MSRSFPPPRVTLDAMTDQALAHVRARRGDTASAPPALLAVAAEVAAVVAEQFPDDPERAGRVVMCVSQMLAGIVVRLQDAQTADGRLGPLVANIFAYAAEQVVREAGTS